MTIRVLIVQGILPEYRVPIFDLLGREPEIGLTIAHAGQPMWHEGLAFEERILRCRTLLKALHYCDGVIELARTHDVVVMMFDPHWLDVFRLLVKRPRGLVFWGHGFGSSRWMRPVRLWLAKRADALVLYGESAAAEFRARGFAAEKLFVAGNTVAVPGHGLDQQVKRNRFLFVGALRPRKAVGDLLHAFSQVCQELPAEVGVTIVGEGEQYDELRALAARLGIADRVVFKGWIFDEALLRQEFARALAYVSPRHVGLGALHSFAYGVPVVTIPTEGLSPEIENIRDGLNGRLYAGSVGELAGILLSFVTDPEQTWRLGRNAYAHYRQRRRPEDMVAGLKAAALRGYANGRERRGKSG